MTAQDAIRTTEEAIEQIAARLSKELQTVSDRIHAEAKKGKRKLECPVKGLSHLSPDDAEVILVILQTRGFTVRMDRMTGDVSVNW